MEVLPRSLLYEIMRYDPWSMFTILSLRKNLRNRVSDPSYLHYFLEECFLLDDVRKLSWDRSLELLSFMLTPDFTVAFYALDKIRVYNHVTHHIQKI